MFILLSIITALLIMHTNNPTLIGISIVAGIIAGAIAILGAI